MRNKISIIITTKNEAKVISDLLFSIKNQTFKDYEIIVVDNYSTDETAKLAKKFGARVFSKGPERSVQRNFGVEKATGRYVLILDADMALDKNVLKEAINNFSRGKLGALVVPEKSFGEGYWAEVKAFERSFYVGDSTIEAARFFDINIFKKFGGYDTKITGPEDYDLPYRMKKTGVKIGRIKSYIFHNEKRFSPIKSAQKKFYYASKASVYLRKHPELATTQGNMIFRPVFFRKWKKLLGHPVLSMSMFFLKALEMIGAALGLAAGLMKSE